MKHLVMPAALALACLAAPAQALVIVDSSGVLTAADSHQQGRLSRSGVPSDWSQDKAFPGIVNTPTSYAFDAISIPFAANATQDVYYQIEIDDPNALLFASAYNGTYNPAALSQNYKGDEGASGNPVPGDTSFFQVKIAAGGSLTLVLNQVGTLLPSYNYTVEAFSDTEYNEDFAAAPAAPEPQSWALMIAGVGLAGGALRGRRRMARVQASGAA